MAIEWVEILDKMKDAVRSVTMPGFKGLEKNLGGLGKRFEKLRGEVVDQGKHIGEINNNLALMQKDISHIADSVETKQKMTALEYRLKSFEEMMAKYRKK